MKRGLLSILLVILAIIVLPSNILAQIITQHGLIPQVDMSKPSVGQMVKEPAFNTNLIRLTDARATNNAGVFPNSARRQSWNIDESLMILSTGDGSTLLYDGQTYKFKKVLADVTGLDIFWHPTDPFLIIYNPANALYSYNVVTDEVKLIHSFADYSFASSKGGNLSDDGRYYAFVGEFPELQADSKSAITQKTKFEKLVLFDIWTDQIVSEHVVVKKFTDVNWISMSPNGYYIVVNYKSELDNFANSINVYDRGFNLIWQQFFGVANGDLAIDANGDEVMIMDRYDSRTNSRFIEKYRLFDGYTTTLLEHSPTFYSNISARNITRFGWCLVSTFDNETRLRDSFDTWLPFEDEIFLLKMDGSQNVERLAHHRSRRFSTTTPNEITSTPFAEPQASISRNADRLLFASNWREDMTSNLSIDAYVVDLRGITTPLSDFSIVLNPESVTLASGQSAEIEVDVKSLGEFSEIVNLDLSISPNPGNFRVFLVTALDGSEKTKVKIMAIADVPVGKYLLHMTGKTTDKIHHAGALVNIINIEQDFRLRVQPAAITVKRGSKVEVMVAIERLGGFSEDVNVWVMDTKALKVKVTPTSVSTTTAMANFTLKAKAKTPLGTHSIVFIAASPNTRTHMAKMLLTVVE